MERQSYVDFCAIVVGTALALAVSIVFLHFGSVIGLTVETDGPWSPETVVGQIITINLWMLWVQVLSSILGGYVAGRMRMPAVGASVHEREVRDGIHGLSVWAVGTVLVAVAAGFTAAIAALSPEVSATTPAEALELDEKAAIVVAFAMAASALVSAVAAWWAGTKGGEHRDDGVDFSKTISFRKL